jgi:uncharacterized protein YcbX
VGNPPFVAREWFAQARAILDEQGARPLRAITDLARGRGPGPRRRAGWNRPPGAGEWLAEGFSTSCDMAPSRVATALDAIYRFPVKGLRGEPLGAVDVAPGHGLPHDRRFAIARGDTRVDAAAPKWLPKQRLVMLMRDAALVRLACRVDFDAGTVCLAAPGAAPCVASFADAEGRGRLEVYLNAYLGARPEGPVRFLESGPLSFTDVPENCLSLVNRESVRAVERLIGRPLHPLRFRANLYVDGGDPWSELGWVGRVVSLGSVELHIRARIPRCAATGVDPESGERDVNVVKALKTHFGHHDMGVYAEVLRGGRLRVGDRVVPPRHAAPRSRMGDRVQFLRFLARNGMVLLRRGR